MRSDAAGSDRLRDRLMGLSASRILAVGVLAQVAVAGAVLAAAVLTGDRFGTLAGWYLVATVLLATAAAAVPALLLTVRRWPRLAAGLSVALAVAVLALTEFTPVTWVLPLFLLVAAGRAWQRAPRTAGPRDA